MKKLFSVVLLAVVLSLVPIVQVGAAPADSGVLAMAQYFPAETAVFAAIRTDEEYINELERFYQQFAVAPLPDLPTMTPREIFNLGLGQLGITLDDLYLWLGDYAAFGLLPNNDSLQQPTGYVVVQITDRAAVESFIEAQIEQNDDSMERDTDGDFTRYSVPGNQYRPILLVGDDVVLLVDAESYPVSLPVAESLLDTADYQAAVAALPADSYNLAAYINSPVILANAETMPNPQDLAMLEELGFSLEDLQPVLVGGTILDKYSLTIDVVQLPGAGAATAEVARVDPAFNAVIPVDASAVIHSTDLSAQLQQVLTIIGAVAQDENVQTQITAALEVVGVDETFYEWTTGDYALFMRVDTRTLAQFVVDNLEQSSPEGVDFSVVTESLDLGFVIDASLNPEAAADFADELTAILTAALGSVPEVTISDATVADVAVTLITIAPQDDSIALQVEFVIGANDEVLFIGTRAAAETVLSGAGGLADAEAYQAAS
ncbi:MAG: hypothetical protein H7Y11_00205, partial [Armatimonadetes bacterium]|nr:hypothetical protein [Anaerolineae bacterium]